jgi:hypothetical protein
MSFTKLEDYFKDRKATYLYVHPSGKRFVVLDADEFVKLTGESLENLILLGKEEPDIFKALENVTKAHSGTVDLSSENSPASGILMAAQEFPNSKKRGVDSLVKVSNTEKHPSRISGRELASLELEDEISVEDLPI